MKSVLFVSLMNGGPWGGSEELWYQSALYAARQGYRVGCAFYEWPQKQERIQLLKDAGCELYLFSNKGRQKRTFLEKMQYKITKRRVRSFGHRLPFSDYDLTVINLGYLEIVSHYWKSLLRYMKKYALLFHVHDENDTIKPTRKTLLRQWVQGASHNLFASARTQQFLEKELSISIPNAGILINPLSFKAPETLTPMPPLQNGNVQFVMLATMDTRRKAQDNLITALSTEKWRKRAWQLNLWGGGDDMEKIKNQVVAAGLAEKINVHGHTKNVQGALKEAHLLLQMTHIDAMPLAVMEALAMGRPMAVSDVGDMPEWITENENGWISEDASVAAIDQTLEKAWQARHRWPEMGGASFRIHQERFPAVPEAAFLKQLGL